MFNWLRRWQNNRKRQIFRFWDGRRNRAVDPLTVWRSFQDDPQFVMDQHLPRLDAAEADSQNAELNPLVQSLGLEAQAITASAMRRAFALPSFESGGMTESECLGLCHDFLSYVASLKKSTKEPVTSPSPTGSVPPSALSIQEAMALVAITKPSSPCGC